MGLSEKDEKKLSEIEKRLQECLDSWYEMFAAKTIDATLVFKTIVLPKEEK